MRIESNLCHYSENKAVVQVTGWINEENIGSTLAEGITVEIAEENAIGRLIKRVNSINNKNVMTDLKAEDKIDTQKKVDLHQININNNINNTNEPNDWSTELTQIDLEINRLKWSREDENIFLEKNFGYNNRSKITNYKELLNYLGLLKNIDNVSSYKDTESNINKLIAESDIILKELSWDHNKGREYLQREFNVSTRKELDEVQLINFVSRLKTIRNQYLTQ